MKNKLLIVCVLVFFTFAFVSGMIIHYNDSGEKIEKLYGVVAEKTEQELILDSDLIIVGTILDISDGKWTNPGFKIEGKNNILRSDIAIKIDEIIFGEYEKETVVLRVDQGRDKENKIMYIADYYPEFKNGEKSVFFLKREIGNLATNEDYFILSGAFQGKFGLENGKLKNDETPNFKEHTIERLAQKTKEEHAKNPDWKKQKEQQQQEIMKNNVQLFGE